ncbi:MAG TPA: 50S ribosomal protein L24 [Pirellulaceae bacterium]|nr:50S ribosomal protein L24 [Pirellulaceae bacterium]HMO92663.1 50S ribosomal protein L24 [Pirellulaceae bacterium]HMP70589.1 50S ribosomal protein L24 [Pirellulaceae bacterium]
MKIHAGDTVKVISGKDKSVTGKVMSVDHEKGRVVVEGVNLVYKHVRPSQRNPQGGRLHKEMPVPASKVMVVCPKTGKPTRVGFRYLKDGSKERYAIASGASLGVVSPPKKAKATKA